mmetsp:Transcript_26564/g.41580  ORF Transcript_26564/g.41580 Transcript_26564/m.41580 type:complete len:277 (+) Transcript_26564:453-1283(+)|eukprot:CAMPEP_0184329140 /NCGR_PEP_ID=MMETSP1049-20130417/143990_1 /TAXON_ID=77928 /ORGANISM="Proteomonas sulcata, Strain CCMP704" /LENGTH=276 /DNA_ID=CAMNT_0026651485 /DNA_START=440 /DNA_END=1270 /DNA_ORIENTATION=+
MGVGAVTTMLFLDEVEHHRCGIGCILEDSAEGEIYIKAIMKGGTADNTAVHEGDVIERVDDHVVHRGMTVAQVSHFVRGKEGSVVTLWIRRPGGDRLTVRLLRQRVPGSKAEMLGMLWQTPNGKGGRPGKEWTQDEKLEKLQRLYNRGNLSQVEFEAAKHRLLHGTDLKLKSEDSINLSDVWNALQEDVGKLTADPEVTKRRALQRQSSSGGSFNSGDGYSKNLYGSSPGHISRGSSFVKSPTPSSPTGPDTPNSPSKMYHLGVNHPTTVSASSMK